MIASLERATADLPAYRGAVARAEQKLTEARSEQERIARKTGQVRAMMNQLHQQARDLKRAAMAAAARDDEAGSKKNFVDYGSCRVSYQRTRDLCSFMTSFAGPDADLAELEASLAERKAVADLHEALAAQKRAELLVAMGPAAAVDSGLGVDLQGTQSQKLLDRAVAIRRDEVPKLEQQIRSHKARVNAERDAVSPALFSVEI
jgi:hypothetical protein